MRLHSHDPRRCRLYYNCPIKRPTRRKGRLRWVVHRQECPQGELCQPQTQMGPVVYTRTQDDPRLYPSIPRHSQEFKDLMAQRSGCERSNSLKKVTYRLGERPCRSASHYLVRLCLADLLQHAKAWLAEDRKLVGDDPIKLLELAQAA